ncbi:TIGR04282 family arsenosugar biosynthesis glycosyltransferase [Lentzea sp. E54]|uniref:TIGR04282 family arsenosugar biosynthesis glycosyltransferase n=1 Tax=Lentzea xerophila TaxID=3435883 RepID=UPI003DA56680
MKFCLLVMAKSPVPGQVKTRLCPPLTPREAADVAAASLLDTLTAALATPGAVPVVALSGVVRREDVRDALAECVVIPQRGTTFAERLVHAHADVARFGMPVLQIGMDTPQVTPSLLESCARFEEAALGFALDGGWWALGLRDPLRAGVLRDVPMSRADTGALTLKALHGLEVRTLPVLSDVDTMADARAVTRLVPGSLFAAALTQAAVAR